MYLSVYLSDRPNAELLDLLLPRPGVEGYRSLNLLKRIRRVALPAPLPGL
jgi:hypothetical protein